MTARVQDSPFRETEWDHRLDKMLDDLKTTVSPDGDQRPSRGRDTSLVSSFSTHHQDKPDPNFLDIFRSSSRSDSRGSSRGIEDLGLMKHYHKEFTSPDKSTRVITDEFEYDSGDPNKNFQKKVKKSTYSSYNVSGGLSDDLDSLRRGPPASIMADAAPSTTETKVVSASQKVANKLVDALSTIGGEEDQRPDPTSGTLETTSSDYSTLTRLNKNINELDHLLENMDKEENERKEEMRETISKTETTKTAIETDSGNIERSQHQSSQKRGETTADSDGPTSNLSSYSKNTKYSSTGLSNGYGDKTGLDDDDFDVTDKTGGEVKRIVWRNRFEKTYETQDSTVPSLSIEEDAKLRNKKQHHSNTTKTLTPFHPQVPPASPGGQPWAEPVPLPTPPQLSPGEPGVAYIYTYGQGGGSQVQHLPPLNYVAGPPVGEGAPSPTPSGSSQQPVVYHYSYHYNIMPGQPLPEGVPQPPGGSRTQPALQVAAPPRQHPPAQIVTQDSAHAKTSSSYDYKTTHNSSVTHSDNKDVHRHIHHHPPGDRSDSFPYSKYGQDEPKKGDPKAPDSNISITINKTTTHTTHTKDFPGGPGEPTSASTPYHIRGRSRSPSPDRYTRGHKYTTGYTRTSYGSDSLERLRKPNTDGLPFPDTSPIKPSADGTIPRKVDELMHSFDSEDGRHHYHNSTVNRQTSPERQPLVSTKLEDDADFAVADSQHKDLLKEKSKNVSGPPVYYPPGHQQLFADSMHTMTLKEDKRRGMAKWRAEKASGNKDSGANADSKGGMAMVPVCLPLCCGAACTIM